MPDLQSASLAGHVMALGGVRGSGKTVPRRRRPQQRQDDTRMRVSKSRAVDPHRITLGPRLPALFSAWSSEPPLRLPTPSEKRARA
jgi:hypothetical protein